MIKFFTFFILSFLFSIQILLGQNQTSHNDLYGILYQHPRGIEGSTFLTDDWCIGTVKLFHGRQVENIRMKYDRLNNNLVYYNDRG